MKPRADTPRVRMRSSGPRRRPTLVAACLWAAVGAGGCRSAAERSRRGSTIDAATGVASSSDAPATGAAREGAPAAERPTTDVALAEVDPGPYVDDERFLGLAASFAERVTAAAERLELSTGIRFEDRPAPRVLLTALRDERVRFRIVTEVADGRRRARLAVNAEPLVAGTDAPDRVLLRGLAAAAFTGAPGISNVPPWFGAWVGLFASGEAADRVLALARARVRGEPLPRVDADDPTAADATGLAVALLLASRSTPQDVRHWIDRVVDGEDPTKSLPRLANAGASDWVTTARRALEDAVSDADADDAAQTRLLAARKALDELGPAGLAEVLDAASVGPPPPAWFRAEADALRLEAAIASGDARLARDALGRHAPEPATLRLLGDPGAYLLDAARAERFEGGDPAVAWERLRRFERDFPRHRSREDAFDEMLALVGHVPAGLDDVILDHVVRERGAAAIDARSARRRIDAALADHRPGAADRFLASLGTRGDAGDLADAREAVLLAQTRPTPEALTVHEARARAWIEHPTRATESDVMDGGAPTAEALGRRIATLAEPVRSDTIRLLVRAGGIARAVAALSPRWPGDRSRRAADLRLLSGEVGHADLVRAVTALDPAEDDDPDVAAGWAHATFGLDAAVLSKDDLLLTRLLSPEFPIRRKAFEDLVDDAGASVSPALVRHMATDPATLLRRRAVLAGGRLGLFDVARRGFEDESFAVRAAAASALAQAKDDAFVPRLEAAAQGAEPDVRVRAACAAALLRFAERGAARLRPIVSLLRDGDAALADAVARALAPESGPGLARAIASELSDEALAPGARMDRAALFRLFVAYRRATGRDAGYDPSLDDAAVRARVADLPEIRSARGHSPDPR